MEHTNLSPGHDDPFFYEWASIHGPMEMIGRDGKVTVETMLYPTGRDQELAANRVLYWNQTKPHIQSRLLVREVTRGPWRVTEGPYG